ncbi:MAG: RnfABCDGE type electron transport complex subunit C [Erysipelotrichales bacterium]
MIFSGKGRINLKGHKELTDQKSPEVINDFEYVYLPLMNMDCTDFEVLVKEEDYVKQGQLIAYRKDKFYVPIFSSVSGTVEGIEKMMSANLKYAQHIKIKNDFKYEKEERDTSLSLDKAQPQDIIEGIKQAGICGNGGSGFPTYIKFTSDCHFDYVLINGVECEPYITIDYHLMKAYMEELILGLKFMMKACGAKNGVIAFKEGKETLLSLAKEATKDIDNIEIREVPDVYPMGWERTLIKEVFNLRYDKLPSEIGLIVNNSTTAIQIGQTFNNKQSFVTGITLSGEALENPTNVIIPIGAKVADVIEKTGGYKNDVSATNARLIMGGPMMGTCVVSDDVAFNSYSNAVNVLYDEGLREKPCLRCSRCVEYCPSGLQSVAIKDAEKAQDVKQLEKLRADTCVSCGLCSYICPSCIPVSDFTTKGKKRLLSSKTK